MKTVLRIAKPDDDVSYLRKRKGFIIRATFLQFGWAINNAGGAISWNEYNIYCLEDTTDAGVVALLKMQNFWKEGLVKN